MNGWLAIAERFGIPLSILAGIAIALWKGLWPWFKEQQKYQQSRMERCEDNAKEFAKVIMSSQAQTAEHLAILDRLCRTVDRIEERVERRRN